MPPEIQPGLDRRALIRRMAAGGAVMWAVPAIDSFVSVAAAASGTLTNVEIRKSGTGNADPTLLELCPNGALASGNAPRGTAVFTRSENPPTITITITLAASAGTATGRQIFILQSNANSCVGGTTVPVGTWLGGVGPQTFSAPIVSGATGFVIAQQQTGGGGNDGWSSRPLVVLA